MHPSKKTVFVHRKKKKKYTENGFLLKTRVDSLQLQAPKPQVIPVSGPPSPNPATWPTKIFIAEKEERKGLKSSTSKEAKHIARGGWGNCWTIIPRRSQRQLGGGQLGQRRAGQEAANGAAGMDPMKCTSVSRYRSRKDGDYSCEIKGGVLP